MPEIKHMPKTQSRWSEDQVRKFIETEDFRYQKLQLPYGLSTIGHDRSATADKIFPKDLTGKTVLDLGSSFGFFCFEAIKRGAARVVGFDVDPESIRKAHLAADCLGADVQFELRDIERQPLEETFDYVLCLNLLHHLKQPIAALDNMIDNTREKLVLEVASIGSHDRGKVGFSWLEQKIVSRLPIIVVSRAGARSKRQVQNFFVTETALENLLLYQRGQFAKVGFQRSDHKDRYIAIAEKRRIENLLVVSGPTSAGKKTLMRKLTSNDLPVLAQMMGTPDGSVWGTPINAAREPTAAEPASPYLLLHHDFLRPMLRGTMSHERDEALDLLKVADNVTFVTVWTPPEILARQVHDAEISKNHRTNKDHHRHVLKLYRDKPERVIREYERWFEFSRQWSDRHFVVAPHEGYLTTSIDEWTGKMRP